MCFVCVSWKKVLSNKPRSIYLAIFRTLAVIQIKLFEVGFAMYWLLQHTHCCEKQQQIHPIPLRTHVYISEKFYHHPPVVVEDSRNARSRGIASTTSSACARLSVRLCTYSNRSKWHIRDRHTNTAPTQHKGTSRWHTATHTVAELDPLGSVSHHGATCHTHTAFHW